MTEGLQPSTYEMIFIFAGLAWAGLLLLGLAVFMGLRRLRTPKPLPILLSAKRKEELRARTRWQRDWDELENNLNK